MDALFLKLLKLFDDLPPNWKKMARKSFAIAWDIFPLERPALERHSLAPQA